MRLAIIGKDSYIGDALALALKGRGHAVDIIDARFDEWKNHDFSGTDSVIHVAAIVHHREITDYGLYRRVNAELPEAIATQARQAGVGQYVLLSTMGVFGREKRLADYMITDADRERRVTDSAYGLSKLDAEHRLTALVSGDFKVALVRPPSVYGAGCRGNLFAIYSRLARMLPVMPSLHRNVLQGTVYIDNLTDAIVQIVEGGLSGAFHPQDREPLSTVDILAVIRRVMGRKAPMSAALGALARLTSPLKEYRKLFGAVTYGAPLANAGLDTSRFITATEGLTRMYKNSNIKK